MLELNTSLNITKKNRREEDEERESMQTQQRVSLAQTEWDQRAAKKQRHGVKRKPVGNEWNPVGCFGTLEDRFSRTNSLDYLQGSDYLQG
ncbi:hypothetical protein BLNAU_17506 [Blattamonas nauphoetae]|uniref:Uncharacterized protein n=1 Tax=Blattamonas nauphoetae TaxID=2049346 RepID=A0ABQ9X745_9EUKA|nr:hypothetical protein BLNAU_17506 [Blattamonas nauphoetae]